MSDIDQLVKDIRQATDFQANKRILKEKIKTELHVPYGDGLFYVTPDLLSFLATWPEEELFLEDVYENPVKVNRTELLTLARQHYTAVMNAWHNQHEQIKRIRKI